MQLGLTSESFLQGDQTWLGSEHGTTNARSVTIVTSSLTPATHFPALAPEVYWASGVPDGMNPLGK